MDNLRSVNDVKLRDLGEAKVIEGLLSLLRRDPKELMGYDDISLVKVSGGYIAIKADSFVESVDLLPGMSPESIGRKLVVMNVSDFAAKGVAPLGMVVSLTAPGGMEWDYLKRIYLGMDVCAKEYGLYIWGGDLSEGKELVLTGCLLGFTDRDDLPRRRGARPGDLIYSTGPFGLTSVAFKILLEGREVSDERLRREALSSIFEPKAELRVGLSLVKHGLVNASIDVSDGLALSLHEISMRSKVKIIVEEVPLHEGVRDFAKENGFDAVDLALYEGGEEYELIFTIPAERAEEACELVKGEGGKLFYIGRVERGEGVYMRHRGGKLVEILKKGWKHYEGWSLTL